MAFNPFGPNNDGAGRALIEAQAEQQRAFNSLSNPQKIINSGIGGALNFSNSLNSSIGPGIMNAFAQQNARNQDQIQGARYIAAFSPVEQARINNEGSLARTNVIFGEGGALGGLLGGGGGSPSFSGPGGQFVGPAGQADTGITPFGGFDQSGQTALGRLGQAQLPQPSGLGGTPDNAIQRQFGNLAQAQADRLGTDFERQIAGESANQRLASQQAIANAGIQGGNLFARMREGQVRGDVSRRGFGLNLAQGLA